MARKTGEKDAAKAQEGYRSPEVFSMESGVGCAVAVSVFILAFVLSGNAFPRFFGSYCTSEQGMCTPGKCDCPAPRIMRELVTQDATPCYQCVDKFCPSVVEGNTTCSEDVCECEDPFWPRTSISPSGQAPCWQCVHPTQELTLRAGKASSECLGPSATGKLGEPLTATSDVSACTVFRYNGVNLASKYSRENCLAWDPSAQFWSLSSCSGTSTFSQRSASEQDGFSASSASDIFCSITALGEFCVQAAEYMCTIDPQQCSTGNGSRCLQ